MKYLMLVCVPAATDGGAANQGAANQGAANQGAAGQPARSGRTQVVEAEPVDPWVEEMNGRGIRLMGHELRPVAETTSVRIRSGEVLVSDGPYAETKEVIAGFDLLECADLAEAIEVAAKHPVAKFGRLELRRFADD